MNRFNEILNTIEIENFEELGETLDLIESGILPVFVNNQVGFIYKDSIQALDKLKNFTFEKLDIEHIDKPEFPSVCVVFYLKKNNKLIKTEYFFSNESEEDRSLLSKMSKQDELIIICVSSNLNIEYYLSIKIPINIKSKINSIINELEV